VYSQLSDPYPVTFRAFAEESPGEQWLGHFARHWPALREVLRVLEPKALSPLAESEVALRLRMPELVPVWERLTALTGHDPLISRVLTLADTPAIIGSCSQAVAGGVLVRNYEYSPAKFEATIWKSALTGRGVIGVTAGLWGLLDGINDAGLAASIAFGGQRRHGPGFAIPLIVRYLLEVCETVGDVEEQLPTLPPTEAYNLTVADRAGRAASFFLTPGEPPRRAPDIAVTNHQETVTWPDHAEFTCTVERQHVLSKLVRAAPRDEVVAAMLQPPLFRTDYASMFGTLYTAAYQPADGVAEYHWPGQSWRQSFRNFDPGERQVLYLGDVSEEDCGPAAAPRNGAGR
jgi:predicted choloylglycine hydrolase